MTSVVPFLSPLGCTLLPSFFCRPTQTQATFHELLSRNCRQGLLFHFLSLRILRESFNAQKKRMEASASEVAHGLRGCSWNLELSASVSYKESTTLWKLLTDVLTNHLLRTRHLCQLRPLNLFFEGHLNLNPLKGPFLNHEEDTGRKLMHKCVYDTKTHVSYVCERERKTRENTDINGLPLGVASKLPWDWGHHCLLHPGAWRVSRNL